MTKVRGFTPHPDKIVLWRPTVLNLKLESGVEATLTGTKMSKLVKLAMRQSSQTPGIIGFTAV